MKRILIFSLAYYPHVGGAEVAIKEITDRITDTEFEMLTLRFGNELREEKIGNVLVRRIGNGGGYFSKILFVPRAAFAAKKLHTQKPFDGAWAMMSYMTFPLTLLRLFGVRIPYVLTLQEGDPASHVFGRLRIRFFSFFLRRGFRQASVVQVISTFLAIWAEEQGYSGVIEVIPNGVDVEKFASAVFSEPKQPVRMITASRLVHKNAIDICIKAIVFLPEHVRLVIVGTGEDEGKLKKLALEKGVSARVDFRGYVTHEQLPGLLKSCDIFIRPSRSEGMGNAFVEAFAAGLPVIATQEGGIADFLFDEKRNPGKSTTGWAVDVDAPEQIARAVQDIVAHPEKVQKVTETAFALAKEKYDWATIAKDMQEKVLSRLQ